MVAARPRPGLPVRAERPQLAAGWAQVGSVPESAALWLWLGLWAVGGGRWARRGGCLVAACRASKQVGANIAAGSSGGGLVPWRLELTVHAGDDFSFSNRAAAIASAVAGLLIDNAAPSSIRSLAVEGLSEADLASGAAPSAVVSGPRLWLSPGLSLADTAGLVALGDGSYGFATPVPEPATGTAMLLSLAALGGLRQVRRSALPAW